MAGRDPLHPQHVLVGKAEADIDDIVIGPRIRGVGDEHRQGRAGLVDVPSDLPIAEVEVEAIRGESARREQAVELARGKPLEGREGPGSKAGRILKSCQGSLRGNGRMLHGKRFLQMVLEVGAADAVITLGRRLPARCLRIMRYSSGTNHKPSGAVRGMRALSAWRAWGELPLGYVDRPEARIRRVGLVQACANGARLGREKGARNLLIRDCSGQLAIR